MKTVIALLMIVCLKLRISRRRQHEADITTLMHTSVNMDEFMDAMRKRSRIRREINRDCDQVDALRAEISAMWHAA